MKQFYLFKSVNSRFISFLLGILFFMCFDQPVKGSATIEKTVYVTVGNSITISPWSVVKSKNPGYSCISTGLVNVSDNTALTITDGTKTTTTFPYMDTGYGTGYYKNYKVKGLQTGVYTINMHVHCAKRSGFDYYDADYIVFYKVVVSKEPEVISISIPNNLVLNIGNSYTFTPVISESGAKTTLHWNSSNSSVLSVNNGTIKAISCGSSIITCTADNGISASCYVTVNPIYITNLTLSDSEIELVEGKRITLTASVSPQNATQKELTWKSSNDNIAFASTDGTIIGISAGYCNVTVSTTDGSNISKSCLVHVVKPITVTAIGTQKEYGDENPTFEFKVEGGELNGVPEIKCEALVSSPVGEYPITISTGSITNKDVVFIDGTLTITKANLTATAKSCTRNQGEENPIFEIIYSGFKNGDTKDVITSEPTIQTEATIDSTPGEYDIVLYGGSSLNYDIHCINGVLTINDSSNGIEIAETPLKEYVWQDNYLTFKAESNGFLRIHTLDGLLILNKKVIKDIQYRIEIKQGLYILNGKKVLFGI